MSAQFFPPTIAVGAGSPGSSGSASGSAGGKHHRALAKSAVAAETKVIRNILSGYPALITAINPLPAKAKLQIIAQSTNGSQTYYVGKEELEQLAEQLDSAVSHLPKKAYAAVKTHRDIADGTGFRAAQMYKVELANFFAQADVGNIVNGQFKTNKKGKSVPDEKTLQEVNQRLNTVLYFTQPALNGTIQNPLYRIATSGMLTPLFSLHLSSVHKRPEDKDAGLVATPLMRQMLRTIMVKAIQNDFNVIATAYAGNPAVVQQAQATAQLFTDAITNPSLANVARDQTGKVILTKDALGKEHPTFVGVNGPVTYVIDAGKSKSKTVTLFNPNSFPFAHISKLISAAKEPLDKASQANLLTAHNEQVRAIYGSLAQYVPSFNTTPSKAVLEYQSSQIALALGHKNALREVSQKEAAKVERAAKKASKATAAITGMPGYLPGALPYQMGGFPAQQQLVQQPQQFVQQAPQFAPQQFQQVPQQFQQAPQFVQQAPQFAM
jgi:hypothetical protein